MTPRQSRRWVRVILTLLLQVMLWLGAPTRASDAIVIAVADVKPVRGFPHVAVDWVTSRIWPLMFDALTEVAEDGTAAPALATSWTARDDHTWVFKLRTGVKFSNGEPFDPQAVIETIDYLKSDRATALPVAREVKNIAAVERASADEIIIRTRQPDALLPARLRTVRILPPRYFAAVGPDNFAQAPHGTGPFMAQALRRGRSVFVANPNAWRPPRSSRIEIIQVGEALARAQAIVSGAADIALNTGPSVDDIVAPSGARIVPYMIASVDVVPFVTVLDTPLKDKRVRLALNYAVNKKELIDAFVGAATGPATQFAPPGTFGYDPSLSAPFPYDPEKAKALLKEAGYPNGFDTAIEVWVDSTDQAAIYQQITADLNAVGVRTHIVNVPVLEWQNDGLYNGIWKAPMFNFSYSGVPSFDSLDALVRHSCLWVKPFNCDRQISDRIVDARATFDRDVRLAKTREIFRSLQADPPAILLFPSIRFDVVGKRMKPFAAPFGLFRYYDMEKSAG